MDYSLSEDEILIRDTVRRFVDDEVIPVMEEAYESARRTFTEVLAGLERSDQAIV